MMVFLYGPDEYRLRQNLDKIIAEYKNKHASGMSFSVLDFSDQAKDRITELTDLIKTTTFFNEKRLVVLKNAFVAGKEIASLLKTWGLAADRQRILVFTETASETEVAKKDRNLFKLLLEKPNLVKTFDLLDGNELEKWAKKEIEKNGVSIQPEALKKLVFYVIGAPNKKEPTDSTACWKLKQEINKLVNYKFADIGSDQKGIITVAEIDLLVTPTIDLNIFETLDAFGNRNKSKALLSLNDQLEAGTDPYYIFSMLVYEFRNLLRVKSLAKDAVPYPDIIKKTGLNPFVVKKTYSQCEKFDLEELKQLFSRLSQLEVNVKLGKIDMTDGLYNFIFSLT